MLYITIIVVAVIISFTVVLCMKFVSDRDRDKEIRELRDRVTALEQTRGKSFKHSECVDLENAIGAIVRADQNASDIEDAVQVVALQAKQAKERIDTAYKLIHTLRGRDREKPVSAPEL